MGRIYYKFAGMPNRGRERLPFEQTQKLLDVETGHGNKCLFIGFQCVKAVLRHAVNPYSRLLLLLGIYTLAVYLAIDNYY